MKYSLGKGKQDPFGIIIIHPEGSFEFLLGSSSGISVVAKGLMGEKGTSAQQALPWVLTIQRNRQAMNLRELTGLVMHEWLGVSIQCTFLYCGAQRGL